APGEAGEARPGQDGSGHALHRGRRGGDRGVDGRGAVPAPGLGTAAVAGRGVVAGARALALRMARGANGRPRLCAVVIGGGPGGLATSRELTRRGVPHVVVERGRLAANWRACYDSLRLHTGKHLSALPGRKFPREAALFPSRDDPVRYLEEYARAFGLPIREGVAAVEAVPVDAGWRVGLEGGETLEASAVVIATGIM